MNFGDVLLIAVAVLSHAYKSIHGYQLYAEGYYPFEEGPNLIPPSVRRPPYTQTNAICPGAQSTLSSASEPSFQNSLCGDLNKGFLPRNPMNQLPLGETYPFELMRNKTLEYLSEVLPLLREDHTIPKVAKFQGQVVGGGLPRKISKRSVTIPNLRSRKNKTPPPANRRSQTVKKPIATTSTTTTTTNPTSTVSTGRGFCDKSNGFLCRFISGFFPHKENTQPISQPQHTIISNRNDPPSDTMPPADLMPPSEGNSNDVHSIPITTPCPSKAEYATPIFAKNYQGLWRYVVQIPFEGYLTQTVEVTRCLQGQCNFLDGHCLASPRWVSLLVAEIFYPHALFPTTPEPDASNNVKRAPKFPSQLDAPSPPVADFENFQQYLVKRASSPADQRTAEKREGDLESEHCDGIDAIGCFQIRLFYDWFLVPGACKCWKPPGQSIFLRRSNP